MQSHPRGSARILRTEAVPVVGAALLLGAILAAGCGTDTTAPVYPRDEVIVDVRDGFWDLTNVTYLTGCDSIAADPDTVNADSVSVCSINFTSVIANPQLVFGVECDSFVDDGTNFSFSCDVGINLEPCVLDVRVEGAGTRDSTSLSYVVRSWAQGIGGPVDPCGVYDVPCTSVVAITGTWLQPLEGDCFPGEIPDAATVSLRSLLGLP